MIVETRYRDIPWEEYIVHFKKEWRGRMHPKTAYERELRGQPVQIESPPVAASATTGFCCDGPFYRIVPNSDGRECVCPHIAEIGD